MLGGDEGIVHAVLIHCADTCSRAMAQHPDCWCPTCSLNENRLGPKGAIAVAKVLSECKALVSLRYAK